MDYKELDGVWTSLNNLKQSYPGKLIYNSDGGIELRLGPILHTEGNANQLDSWGYYSSKSEVFIGYATNAQTTNYFTCVDCTNTKWSLGRFGQMSFRVGHVYENIQAFEPELIRFSRISLEFPHLIDWGGFMMHPDHPFKLVMEARKLDLDQEFEKKDVSNTPYHISLKAGTRYKADKITSKMEVQFNTWLEINFEESKGAQSILDLVQCLKYAFEFFVGAPLYVKSLFLFPDQKYDHVHFSSFNEKSFPTKLNQTIVQYYHHLDNDYMPLVCSKLLNDTVARWIKFYEEFRPSLEMVFEVLEDRSIHAINRFLNLSFYIDSFTKWKYASGKFEDRIQALFVDYNFLSEPLKIDQTDFSIKWRNTRNHLVHHRAEKETGKRFELEHISHVNIQILAYVFATVYRELGLDGFEIFESLKKAPLFHQLNLK